MALINYLFTLTYGLKKLNYLEIIKCRPDADLTDL